MTGGLTQKTVIEVLDVSGPVSALRGRPPADKRLCPSQELDHWPGPLLFGGGSGGEVEIPSPWANPLPGRNRRAINLDNRRHPHPCILCKITLAGAGRIIDICAGLKTCGRLDPTEKVRTGRRLTIRFAYPAAYNRPPMSTGVFRSYCVCRMNPTE